jgi:protein associated with RNAse G/E
MRDTGQWLLDDEDEFTENASRWAYPADVVKKAQETATWLVGQAKVLKPPFGFKLMDEVLEYYCGDNVEHFAYECLPMKTG